MYSTNYWAWKMEGLPSSTHKFLLIALADMADEEHSCFPGQERLAKMLNASVSTIRRTMHDLEALGLVTHERRQQRSTGLRTSDRYYLHPPAEEDELPVNLTGNKLAVKSEELPVKSEELPVNCEQTEEPEEDSVLKSQRAETIKPTTKRGTRVPEDFTPSHELVEWAATYAPSVALDVQTESFKDYWRGVPGARGLKSDWVGAWRNWMRKDHFWALERGWKPEEPIHRFGGGNSAA